MKDLARRLELFVLARLLVPVRKMTVAQLRKDLWPLVETLLSDRDFGVLMEGLLAALEVRGDILAKPLRLSDQGRATALAALQLSRPPRGNWTAVKKQVLATLALGLQPSDAKVQGGLRAGGTVLQGQALRQAHALPIDSAPSLRRALDALLWRELGVETHEAFSIGRVRVHLMKQMLATRVSYPESKLNALAVARAAGAHSTELGAMVDTVLRRWLETGCGVCVRTFSLMASDSTSTPESVRVPPSSNAVATQRCPAFLTPAEFSERVLAAARSPHARRFGSDQVFISSVWEHLRQERPFVDWTLHEFKQRLGEANRCGMLSLSRADLVPAMDGSDVATSETVYLNATFHFINLRVVG